MAHAHRCAALTRRLASACPLLKSGRCKPHGSSMAVGCFSAESRWCCAGHAWANCCMCGVGANCVRVTTGPRRRCAHQHDFASLDAAAGSWRLSCGEVPAAGTDPGTRATPGLPSRESCGHGRTGPAPPTSRMGLAPYPSPCSWRCAVPRCRARARARPHRCATTATTSTLSGALTGRQPSPVPLNTTGMHAQGILGQAPRRPLASHALRLPPLTA